jgi:hypothetical protein
MGLEMAALRASAQALQVQAAEATGRARTAEWRLQEAQARLGMPVQGATT